MALILTAGAFGATIKTAGSLVWSDGLAYFLYARSAVIDHDTDITNEFDDLDSRFPLDSDFMRSLRDWSKRDPATGRIRAPWPTGYGLLMAPLYAAGYGLELLLAKTQDRPADSYGLIPQFFFALGSPIAGLLGFWANFLFCRRIAGVKAAYLGSAGIVLASPAVFYIFFNPTMAHAASFGLASVLTLLWMTQWNRSVAIRSMALMGLVLGIMATVRYQNVLFGCLIAALLFRELAERRWHQAVSMGGVAAAGFLLPQFVVRFFRPDLPAAPSAGLPSIHGTVVEISGYPIDLASPFFFNVLFSCRQGAFYWAPLLALGLAGLLIAAYKANWARVLIVAFLVQVYLIGGLGLAGSTPGETTGTVDWNTYWGGASSFGMRYLTESSVYLTLGVAALIEWCGRFRLSKAWYPALGLLIAWNFLLVLAYGLNTISRSYCVSYSEMFSGIVNALSIILLKHPIS